MRTTTKSLMIAALVAVATGRTAAAQGTPALMAHTLTAVVPTIVRVVMVSGAQGEPEMRVISNDHRFQALSAAELHPDVVAGAVAYRPAGRSTGGAQSMAGGVSTEPTVITYTIALP